MVVVPPSVASFGKQPVVGNAAENESANASKTNPRARPAGKRSAFDPSFITREPSTNRLFLSCFMRSGWIALVCTTSLSSPAFPLDRIGPHLLDKVERRLRAIDPAYASRGRRYALEGRVERITVESGDEVSAVVNGSQPYFVTIAETSDDIATACSCPAWDRMGTCKHVAAVLYALREGRTNVARERERERADDPTSRFLKELGGITIEELADAIGRHGDKAIDLPPEPWRGAFEWWQQTKRREDGRTVRFREAVAKWTPTLESDFAKIRAWMPPPRRGQAQNDFEALRDAIAGEARRMRGGVFNRTLPGPFDEGAARFVFTYKPEQSLLEIAERAPRGLTTRRFSLPIPDRPEAGVAIPSSWGQRPSLWDSFVLRGLLLALDERTDPAILALARDLERPRWERMLDATKTKERGAPASAADMEIAFRIAHTYEADAVTVTALSRRIGGGRSKPTAWKRAAFESLLDGSIAVSDLERQIARSALPSVGHRLEAGVALGTARGHETMQLLVRHPRLLFDTWEKDSIIDAPPRIAAGDMTMHMTVTDDTGLRPTFEVAGHPIAPSALTAAAKNYFGAVQDDGLVVSARIPPALRAWLRAAVRFGDDFVFPPAAASKVVTELEPLVTQGAAILPEEALGVRLDYSPAAALRVEWKPDGAVLEVLIAPRLGAPPIEAAIGPVLYTFEDAGRRAYVERDFRAEEALVRNIAERIDEDVALSWLAGTGLAGDLESCLALARFVEENPLGLAIEVKIGRAPKVTAFEQTQRSIEIVKEASWFSVRGNIELAGKNLSLGELLEAARLARRFVRIGEGSYLELSAKVQSALLPLATAAALGDSRGAEEGAVRVNAAFVEALVGGAANFSDRSGVNPKVLARSLEESRTKAVRPSLEAGTLRPYQREGVAWMLRLAAWAPGCVLADDMGLGKTVQTASVLLARASKGPALVVAPASVCSNWISELARFAPKLKVSWFNEDRAALEKAASGGNVVVVSYGMLQRDPERFAKTQWSTLVLDEAHFLKNHVARRTDAVKTIPRDFAIALTGTPLENHLGELWSLMDVVFPGLLGREAIFRERFRRPIEGNKDARSLAALSSLIGPFLLRRTRAVVLEELPPREEIVEYVDLDAAESKRYAALRRACEVEFAQGEDATGARQAQLKIALLAALTRLRQLACDVSLVDPSFTGPSSKLTRATELVSQIVDEKSRVLVFSQFTSLLERAEKSFLAAGLKVAYLAGDTPTLQRKKIVDAFQAGDFDVFCISLKAGGTGLNLTRASYVVHLDPWWNPAVEEQATARAHRMGQTEPVTVYKLVTRGTIEEAILEMHAVKKDLVDAVLEGRSTSRALSPGELLSLLRFGDS